MSLQAAPLAGKLTGMRNLLDDECPTSANLGNDHEFIRDKYILHWYETFWRSPKQSHESLGSKWTISYNSQVRRQKIRNWGHVLTTIIQFTSSEAENKKLGARSNNK